MPNNPIAVGPWRCGTNEPLLFIAGPCVIESEQLVLEVAKRLADLSAIRLRLQVVYKSSFDKANRTRVDSFRGPGLERGLEILARVREATGLPLLTDVHDPSQAEPAAAVCQIVQVPAFLARQTGSCGSGRIRHRTTWRRGQYQEAAVRSTRRHDSRRQEMRSVRKSQCAADRTGDHVWVWAAGQRFPVHSRHARIWGAGHFRCDAQCPTFPGGTTTGGRRDLVPFLARAGSGSADVTECSLETHPNPDAALSDGPNMLPLDELPRLIEQLVQLRKLALEFRK